MVSSLPVSWCLLSVLFALQASAIMADTSEIRRDAYFGDVHIHTLYSFDAFMSNARATPNDAYRYAKGEAIPHPSGEMLRLEGPPLDFLMVSDHDVFLGVMAAQLDPSSPVYGDPEAAQLLPPPGTPLDQLAARLRQLASREPVFMSGEVTEYAWSKIVEAAERHNDPGRFTAFIGYEYSLTPGNRHLHRNVVFRSGKVPVRPFSALDSENPEDLWDWLDRLREEGIDAIAIPHNMNQSDGLAFQSTTWTGETMDEAFARKRMRNEPVAEISQIKGTSETHPSLSPNDEWAGFQIVRYYLNRTANSHPISVFKGGYFRDALKTGLEFRERDGFNPYQMGVIGSSDSHLGAGPYDEQNYFTGGRNLPQGRGSAYPADRDSWDDFWTPRQATHGTGGLAGVWAEENSRAAIFDAMRRRETFATSGPRIRIRLFGGRELPEGIANSADLATLGYRHGVPMGAVLPAPLSRAPSFVVWAMRDPRSGWLQRLQIIKGWMEDGESKEAVYDVGCSDGGVPDPSTHRCPDNGARVNPADCSISSDKGAVELSTVWQDPEFDPHAQAFYYARVLENPSCRWSTWDAIRIGIQPNPDLPAVHQERAWSSPIWYEPETSHTDPVPLAVTDAQ